MSRESLFKAKDKDDGKWYEGYYMCLHDTTYCAMPSGNQEEAKRLEAENTHHYIVFERMTDWGLPNKYLRAEIDPATLCQYTGLTDKNGKKIWENDVVKYHFREDVAIIKFGKYQNCFDSQKTCHVGFYVDWQKGYMRKDLGYWIEMIDCNVIGNMFDNPELLRGEDDEQTD